jgi:predicted  nucleic acid-binding Zn-ribbon protein
MLAPSLLRPGSSLAVYDQCPVAMHPDLERIVRLQDVESELRAVEAERNNVPKVRAAIEAKLTEERSRLDTAREALGTSQKNRRQHEAGLQDLESKRSKYKAQLMEVKTNREYTAMIHEIEGVEREIRAVEDRILQEMERSELLAAEVKREEAAFEQIEDAVGAEILRVEARTRELQQRVRALEAARDAAAQNVPPGLLELFHRVARLRGTGVSAAGDGICAACRVKLRPQMYVDLKRHDTIIQCPSCSRILHYVETQPPAHAQP